MHSRTIKELLYESIHINVEKTTKMTLYELIAQMKIQMTMNFV